MTLNHRLQRTRSGGVRSPQEVEPERLGALVKETQLERIRTSTLDIAYEHSGSPDAFPVVLLHGFPYDPRSFDGVVRILTARGFGVIVPYLRGYGGTRFLSPDTMRSGEQAAIGLD